MQTITLGRTGLKATIAGLGCGGFSRIGLKAYGLDHAAGIVRAAWYGGLNFFDTAAAYGTQEAVAKGLSGINRTDYILSTKFSYKNKGPGDLENSLEESLRQLKTDYVDIYHIHGVTPEDYNSVKETLYPALQKAKQAGKIRFMGITETFAGDTAHKMLTHALTDNLFDVIMVGYNLLNPSAAAWVLPETREKKVGVLCMHAVRKALCDPVQLEKDISRILELKQADPDLVKDKNSLDFLVQNGAAASIMEAAYRFCHHTPGIDIVLTGTGSTDHLKENFAAIQGPPLPPEILKKLSAMFGKVDCVSGQ